MESPLSDEGATPLSSEDLESLIPTHITRRGELNEYEKRGVLEAVGWAFARRRSTSTLLDEKFIRALHRRMSGRVWKWAGTYRVRETANLGVDPRTIQVELRNLLDDVRYWLEHGTYPPDEIAVRFHYRLVYIHPFPNGNGRLSRLMGDLLIEAQHGERFSWGERSLSGGEARARYLTAVRAADKGDLAPLLVFARLP